MTPSLRLNGHEQDLVRELLNKEVRFVVIGGHAVRCYLTDRVVNDLDVLIELTAENADRLKCALASLPNRHLLTDENIADLLSGSPKRQIDIWASRYDDEPYANIITAIDGVNFDDAAKHAVIALDRSNLMVPVLSIDHLIRSKELRPEAKHKDDVSSLRKLHQ